ncbi:MAG: extracellular solute-binding protein [Verrucomicrobiota bacterium]
MSLGIRRIPGDGDRAKSGPDPGDFIPAVRQHCGEWEGKTYALPMACNVITLLYRTDVFAARAAEFARQTGRQLVPPRTWGEYLEVAQFLNHESLYGNVIMGLKEQNFTVWSGLLEGLGGHLVDAQWRPTLNSAAGVQGLTAFVKMFQYAPPGSWNSSTDEANALFLQGKGAMYLTWPSLIWAQLRDTNVCKITGKIGAAVIPGGRPQLSAWSLGINRSCRDPDAAYRWIEFFVNATNSRRLFMQYGKGSPRLATYQDAECKGTVFYLEQVLEGFTHSQARFRIPPSQELCDYLDNQIAETIRGRISPQAALDRTAGRWREILTQTGYVRE